MKQVVRTLMIACLTVGGLSFANLSAQAQSIAGEYQVEVRGTTYYLDREPVEKRLQDNTSLIVKQQGDQITLEFRSFASAMSTTVFHGRVGNNRFVATWSSGSDIRLITGTVDGKRLRGRLIYPRASADAGVPGWTEVEFAASLDQSRTQQTSAVPPKRPPPGGTVAANAEDVFSVEVVAMTDVDAPLAGHRIEFLARVTPESRGESVERVELWIDGRARGASAGNILEVTAGPFKAGRLAYDVVAVSSDGRRSAMSRNYVTVAQAGNTTIYGEITGNPDVIENVQLMHSDGRSVIKTPISSDGSYRLVSVPRGKYTIFVNEGKAEAMISPSPNLEIEVDGQSSYRRNFEVR